MPLRTGTVLLSNAANNQPQHPGQLITSTGTAQHIAQTIQDQHNELHTFCEATGVEYALA